jgi:hypothetical protein
MPHIPRPWTGGETLTNELMIDLEQRLAAYTDSVASSLDSRVDTLESSGGGSYPAGTLVTRQYNYTTDTWPARSYAGPVLWVAPTDTPDSSEVQDGDFFEYYDLPQLSLPTRGLVALFDADLLALADGAAVSSWNNETGGADATQATGTAQPTVQTNEIGGRKVVRFDGTSDFMDTTLGITSDPSHTYIIVYRQAALSAAGRAMIGSIGAGGSEFGIENNILMHVKENYIVLTYTNGTAPNVPGTPMIAGLTWSDDGTTRASRFYVNSNTSYGNTVTSQTSLVAGTTMSIGGNRAGAGAEFFNGDIAYIAAWDVVLTEEEIGQAMAYLGDRFGITVTVS